MITEKDIERINWLYKKSKTDGLTENEKTEQQILRQKYIDSVKSQVKQQLDTIKPEHRNCDHSHSHDKDCKCHNH